MDEELLAKFREIEKRPLTGVLSNDTSLDPEARLELLPYRYPSADIIVDGDYEKYDEDPTAAFIEVIDGMLYSLAFAGMVGTVELVQGSVPPSNREAVKRAMESFTENDLVVSWEKVIRALEEHEERLR